MKTILAAVDFSPATESVISSLADFARALDARVIFLNVVQIPLTLVAGQLGVNESAEIMAATERDAFSRLKGLAERIGLPSVETVILTGSPVDEIVREASQSEADFIVVGSHGHSSFYEILVGSTTHGIMRRAHCPVLVVPARDRRLDEAARVSRAVATAHLER